MTDSDSVERTDDGTVTPESEEQAAAPRRRRPSRKILIIAAAGVVVLAGVGALVFALVQPSQIERAGEACSGTKPWQIFMDEVAASESPEPDESEDADEDDAEDADKEDDGEAFAEYFDGVVSVEDDGSTLIVNTKPDDDDPLGISSLAMECVFTELDTPKHITERVGATRSLDGRQDGDWDGYSASWSYHPDDGANVIIVAE